jgi:ABC-2 type transport system ATP-binding protein
LWRAIRDLAAQGCAVLLTTHYLEEAEALADRVMVIDHGRLLAQGSVEEMRARVAQRRIGCVSSLSPALVSTWPGVQEARVDADGRLQIVAANAEPVVRRLLAEDPALSGLEVRRAGLADAFLALTGESARSANVLEEAA